MAGSIIDAVKAKSFFGNGATQPSIKAKVTELRGKAVAAPVFKKAIDGLVADGKLEKGSFPKANSYRAPKTEGEKPKKTIAKKPASSKKK